MADEAKARRVVEDDAEHEGFVGVVGSADASAEPKAALHTALDTLDEKVKLLIARHARLGERYVEALDALRDAEKRLQRMSSGELDPEALEKQVRELEARNARLARHAAYLEDRIESLMARVRYVVES